MPVRTAHRKVATVIVLVLAILTAGCDSGQNNGQTHNSLTISTPPPAGILPAPSIDALVFPVDAYRVSAQENQAILNAVQKLIGKCAATFGVDYPTDLQPVTAVNDYSRLYGVTDLASARQYGYEPGPGAATSGGSTGRGRGPAMSRDAATVISGWPGGRAGDPQHPPKNLTYGGKPVPVGGCAGEAKRRLGIGPDDNPQDPTLVRTIADSASHQAEADPRVVAGFQAWSTCMKAAGYNYRTPWDPQDAAWPKPTSANEINTAVADVTCKKKGNLVGIWYGVEVAYEKVLIQRKITGLAEEKKHVDQLAAAAVQVLAAG